MSNLYRSHFPGKQCNPFSQSRNSIRIFLEQDERNKYFYTVNTSKYTFSTNPLCSIAPNHFVRKLVSNPQPNMSMHAPQFFSNSTKNIVPGHLVIFEISIPSFTLPEMSPKQCYEMTGPDVVLTFGPNLALTKCFAQPKIGLLQNGMIHWAQVVAKWFLSL